MVARAVLTRARTCSLLCVPLSISIEWHATLCAPWPPSPLMASRRRHRAAPRPARSAGPIQVIAHASSAIGNLATCQARPLLHPYHDELQFEDSPPLATLRPNDNASSICLAPYTSIQFRGTVSSPCSPPSRAHPIFTATAFPTPLTRSRHHRPSRRLPCARGRTHSARPRLIHHIW